jgi:hypothetical protein
MKIKYFYALALIIIALGATSCAKKNIPHSEEEDFIEADLDDGPMCGCEDNVYHLRYIYNSPTII